MLKPDKDRLNYGKLLAPPIGYEVDFAIGTTYSLDLEALIGVPVAFSITDEMDQTFQENPIYVIEGLRKSAKKFALFCEAGQIKVPQSGNEIMVLLEDSVFEVALKNEKSFHPKIWLVKYINSNKKILYRLIVLTRNLTFDRSWDIAVSMEGKVVGNPINKNKPLVDFIKFLIPFTKNKERKKQIRRMLNELMYIQFQTGNKHIPDFDFYPLGFNAYDKQSIDLFDTYHNLLIFTPFLSKNMIDEFNEKSLKNPQKILITRRTELPKLPSSILTHFDIYVLKDTIVEGEGILSEGNEEIDDHQLQDIHAKLYLKSKYSEHDLYIGSANCSHNAFHGNVEFLLKLKLEKRGFKINDVLNDLFGSDEEDNPFERIVELAEWEKPEEDLQEKLQQVIKQLVRSNGNARAFPKDNKYLLQVTFSKIPSDVDLSIRPLLSKKMKKLDYNTLFENLDILELSQFYVVNAKLDDETVERVLKINTEGLPEDRTNKIFQQIIHDSRTFLEYIAFLLADDYLLSAIEQMNQKLKYPGALKEDWSDDTLVLYENMLKAASRFPEKLKDIQQIIELIDDKKIIPESFNDFYQTFRAAIKKV